eukprot:CAMPEP_0170550336 /NCGR_PEP_ID=MMETSP0211-20121228/8391_1 /TAXON_ID=311385 /ORGANISM="Pseudokeronopsis sp., Strain OXSARD2" /LENGTH=56 /DNA_ID=CAMNT_0010856825 /DNA_START=622 /DNA_END=792 /DNA_ORIENTATION=+
MKNIRTKAREERVKQILPENEDDDDDIEIFEVNNALSQKMQQLKNSYVSNENNGAK